MYKYIAGDYHEELTHNLLHIIQRRMTVHTPGSLSASEQQRLQANRLQVAKMQCLYGTDTLPDDLIDCFNADLTQMQHVAESTSDTKDPTTSLFFSELT